MEDEIIKEPTERNMSSKMIRHANLLLLLGAFFLLFWSLGDRGLWSSEGRWAEIVREMFTSGDFFHPTIGGEPYFDKPLFTYWVIAAISAVTGRLDEFIIRLPSAIAGFLTLICTIYLGKRLWSRQAGWLAGGLLLTSYGLLRYSYVASAETENLAAIMLAVTWYWTRRNQPGFVSFLVFYLILFVGSHMKGLTAFVVPVLVILPDLLRERRWRWLFRPSHLLAFGIGIAVYLAPFVYASVNRPESYEQSGLFMVFRENVLRYVKPFDHKAPIYIYLGAVPLLTLPWVPILIGALVVTIGNWKKLDYNTRWLTQAILLIFAFFTLSGSRRVYYILPILPFCTLLMAVFIAEFSQEIVKAHRDRGLRIQKQILIIVAILELVFGPVAVWFMITKRGWELPSLLGWSFLFIGLAALLVAVVAQKLATKIQLHGHLYTIWALILIAGVLQGGFFAWQNNILDSRRTEKPFAMQLKSVVDSLPHERVAFWHKCEDKVLFYLKWNPPITLLSDENDLREFIESGEPGIVISQHRFASQKTASSMLPSQPAYVETCYMWESPTIREKKLKAWLINSDTSRFAMENLEANGAK
jgi:4-amino-4-deoxy-L-arabinose transferase-like glycosyltransferase